MGKSIPWIAFRGVFFLGPQWCVLCKGASKDLEILITCCGPISFLRDIWDHCFLVFWESSTRTRDCWAVIEEVLSSPPFKKGVVFCGRSFSLLLCGVFGL